MESYTNSHVFSWERCMSAMRITKAQTETLFIPSQSLQRSDLNISQKSSYANICLMSNVGVGITRTSIISSEVCDQLCLKMITLYVNTSNVIEEIVIDPDHPSCKTMACDECCKGRNLLDYHHENSSGNVEYKKWVLLRKWKIY